MNLMAKMRAEQAARDKDVTVGDYIKDNDPRMKDRVLKVIRTSDWYVWATRPHATIEYRIKRDRIHTDGKARRTGFSLMKESS